MMQLKYKANGVNFHVQMRSLNWREIDARAETIVADPTKRLTDRERRKIGCLDDPKPRRGK